MESAGATHSDEGRRGETEIDNPAGASSDLADDQIFMRMRRSV